MTRSRGSPSRTRLSETKSVQDSPNLLFKLRTNCNQETNGVSLTLKNNTKAVFVCFQETEQMEGTVTRLQVVLWPALL